MIMRSRLKHVFLVDFKSYQGAHRIGELKPFNAVIGPNGAGKSNFTDAISFVMGDSVQNLRVRRLADLIHGAVEGRPTSQKASVTAVFSITDDEGSQHEMTFQRVINVSRSEYKINDQDVSNEKYLAELKKLGVNIKAKNFLVLQGAVEAIVLKTPKEMTAMLEKLSGSDELKEQYDRLKLEMEKLTVDLNSTHQRKKVVNADTKQARLEKQEADDYMKKQKNLNDKLLQYKLFQLYHHERENEDLEKDLKAKLKAAEKFEVKNVECEQTLRENKKAHGVCGRQLAQIEQDLREVEAEVSTKRSQLIKVEEKVLHMQKKLSGAVKMLEQAQEAKEAHKNDIRLLEDEAALVEQARTEYEAFVTTESQSQGRDINLEDEQAREYYRLKKEANQQTTIYTQQLDSIIRQQQEYQDQADNLRRFRTNIINIHRQKNLQKEGIQVHVQKLTTHIQDLEQALFEKQQLRDNLKSEVNTSRDRAQQIRETLGEVLKTLGDAKADKREDARQKRREEVVGHLQKCFSIVYGRLIDMCQPTHQRYNLAVTKVFGKHMNSIVVDTKHTARQCIQYLKDHALEVETFLPLNYIKVQPLKDNTITEPRGVRRLYDVVCFEPEEIADAVNLATNHTLVCETPEDAMQVAYELETLNNAVALDGTFYRKSGLISGGSLDLAHKAKRWNEKHVTELENQKEQLTEELRDILKNQKKEFELTNVETQIQGLTNWLRDAKQNMAEWLEQLEVLEPELARLDLEIIDLDEEGSEITQVARAMQMQEQQMQQITSQINGVEDGLFANFCQEVGVRDIRQYENRELCVQQEREGKRLSFQTQLGRISNHLQYKHSCDENIESKLKLREDMIKDDEQKLESYKKAEEKQREAIDKDLQKVEELKSSKVSKKEECERLLKEVEKSRQELKKAASDLKSAQRETEPLKRKIESNKSKRHQILVQCKGEGVVIPLLVCNMEALQPDPFSQSSSAHTEPTTGSSEQQYEKEAGIQIDYTKLSLHQKCLEDKDEISEMAEQLLEEVKTVQTTLNKIKTPNMKAQEKLNQAQNLLQSTHEQFESLRKRSKELKNEFNRVKQKRFQTFSRCFDRVAEEIGVIYKMLLQDGTAQAFLQADNADEPYLEGIHYNCIVPGKRFQSKMSALSGGEKTLAAIALLFAMRSYQPAPFFVLDEIDATLDQSNVRKVCSYLRERAESLQFITVSHNEKFYSHADQLVGIFIEPDTGFGSHALTVNLEKYRT